MERVSTLKVVDVIKETEDAVSIHFKQPFFGKLKYISGQFLTILVDVEGEVERRCYSLNSAPKVDKTISITVKRIKDGKVSNHVFNTVKVGDKMKVLHPMGEFKLAPDPKIKRHVVLFGAGSGITPLMSILKSIIYKEPKSTVSLFYGNRDVESIIFNEELNAIAEEYKERLNLIHILEEPGDFEDCYKGRVERSQVPELLNKVPKFPFGQTECFICGPSGMMVEAEEGLKMAGVPEENINIEKFSAPPVPSAQEMQAVGAFLENREVVIELKGKKYPVPVKANKYILDAALDEKIKLPYVCMDGICGSCKAEKVSGEVFMRKGHVLTKKEVENNIILPCICKPITNGVVIKYA
ncbi:ferredoxin--NADP reductase [Reichenbachiella versicolor]|uniref:ferredoxin--NADP reductase n=1 Tax=Reichenbachiella versicolor TaxID=1821036 RepID=UPI000D6E5A35|nr:ferredoxin--NADP reductase [Reichenbachiella versicolor]